MQQKTEKHDDQFFENRFIHPEYCKEIKQKTIHTARKKCCKQKQKSDDPIFENRYIRKKKTLNFRYKKQKF